MQQRRRCRGVEPRRPGAARRGSNRCACPSSPRSTAPASAAGSRPRSPATIASPPIIRRRCSPCPRCSSASFPGAGGTQRLPRLIGLQRALDMILTGPQHPGEEGATRWASSTRSCIRRSSARSRSIARASSPTARSSRATRRRDAAPTGVLLEDNPIGRSIVFRKAREGVMAKTHGHYPAPLAALAAVQAGYDGGGELGYRAGVALVRRARDDRRREGAHLPLLRHDGAQEGSRRRRRRRPSRATIETLGVLGAGFMGAGIASIAVQQGTPVRLKDTDLARVGKGIAAVSEVLRERLKKKQITRLAVRGPAAPRRRHGRVHGLRPRRRSSSRRCSRISRSSTACCARSSRCCATTPIYASNTSTIPIARIAEAAARPNRVLGMHFFSPVHKMPLLEVIATGETDDDAIVTAVAYGKQLGKTVIVVNDAPGFYTTRILSAYMNEAGRLLDEGASIDAVDAALTSLRFPGRADHPARRGRHRRRRQGRPGARRGVRRAHGAERLAPPRRRVGPHRAKGAEGLLPLRRDGKKGRRRPVGV